MNKQMKKRVSEEITIDEMNKWKQGDIISIKAGTGAGKSYFIKNGLYKLAKQKNKKILILIHRKNCVNQFQAEIEAGKKQDVIDIKTYQSIEAMYKKGKKFDFSQYQYIVSDEFHYFMGDSVFNKFVDISLEEILKQTNIIKIFMSATGETMINFLKKIKKLDVISYELPVTFDHIRELFFFNKEETLEKLIDDCITNQKKAIVFIQSAKEAYNLFKKYKKHAMFNCSESHSLYKFVDKEKIKNMLDIEKFSDLILITTTCMDAGVNLIDEDLRTVICDVNDTDTMIQCIGRKRLQTDDDYVEVYVKTKSKAQISAILRDKKEIFEKAEFLDENGIDAYLKKYPRDADDSGIIYDELENEQLIKKRNDLVYCKYRLDSRELNFIYKHGYRVCIADWLGRRWNDSEKKYDYIDLEEKQNIENLTQYLDSIVDKMLFKDQQEQLKEIFKTNGLVARTQGINSLNEYIKIKKLNYKIFSRVDKRRKLDDGSTNPNRDKTYWIVKSIAL